MWLILHLIKKLSELNKYIILINILIFSLNVNASSFKLTSSTKYCNQIPVQKYVSEQTGLTVILADVEGPDVNGYFLLATEATDDDGLPHTLEHIVFMGSELYPFKGILDLLGNRCLASGTNAWTSIDHTCYTLSTVGSEGFLSLLPIYIDHILYPTLTDASFITEVHHVSGEGEDGGVVYSEMQFRENHAFSRIRLQMIRGMFPNSSYCAETGGILHNLRTSTTIEKIRDYHSVYYRPENLFLIITGKVLPEDVFEALHTVEDRIIQKGELPPFERPFQTPFEPLTSSKVLKTVYPSDEEDRGEVMISWRGPKPEPSKMLSIKACSIMLNYLSDTSVSPLQKEFIEVDDPYASGIGGYVRERMESVLFILFSNVPLEKIDFIYKKLMDVLNKIVQRDQRIDMERMKNIINQEIMQALSGIEKNPHGTVSTKIINDCLYGNSDEEFKYRLDPIKQLKEILTLSESFWIGLIKDYLIEGHYVLVKSVPSIQKQKQNAQTEIDRIEKQRNDLGKDGLLRKKKELMDAKAINEIPPPIEMLTEVGVPGTERINFHSIKIYRSGDIENPLGLDLNLLPVYAEAYDIHTNFVYIFATVNTANLPRDFRPYLPLFLELLSESPISHGNFLIPYEEVVAALQKDTVSSYFKLGFERSYRFLSGSFSRTAVLLLQMEPKKYDKGAIWITDLLYNTEFLIDRIRVCAGKIANDVAQEKRNGYSVAQSILKSLFYTENSNVVQSSMLRQHKFLTTLLQRLENPKTAQSVIDNLNAVRSNITDPSNLSIHIAADFGKLSKMGINLNKPWSQIVPLCQAKNELKINPDWKIVKPNGNFPNSSGAIVGMGSVDSALLFQASPSIKDFMDPDLPALMVFLKYLTQKEGPLWRQIRGQGLAYGFSMNPLPVEGLLSFNLYRATNVVEAYKKAKAITEAQLVENAVWEQTLLESAKSLLVFEIITQEKSVGDLVTQSFISSFKQIPLNYNQILLRLVNSVTEQDLIRVGKLYVASIFSNKAKISIVSHPDKVNEIAKGFEQWGHNFFIRKTFNKKNI